MRPRWALTALMVVSVWVTPSFAAPVCLYTYRIEKTVVPNARTILFHMKDGTIWRNTLKTACPDLKFWGFVYNDRSGTGEICDNLAAIRVINSGEVCMLGAFSPEPKTPRS